MSEDKCVLCGLEKPQNESHSQTLTVNCKRCGTYKVSIDFLTVIPEKPDKHLKGKLTMLSGYAKELTYKKKNPPLFTAENYSSIAEKDPLIPKKFGRKN